MNNWSCNLIANPIIHDVLFGRFFVTIHCPQIVSNSKIQVMNRVNLFIVYFPLLSAS